MEGGGLPQWVSSEDAMLAMLAMHGAWVWSLVRELDPICCNKD